MTISSGESGIPGKLEGVSPSGWPLSKYFGAHPNELMEILPSGNSKVKYDS
ncbi:MAG: hypothetical protein ABII22_06955 [Candidatus Micrarchaeota archaeon]